MEMSDEAQRLAIAAKRVIYELPGAVDVVTTKDLPYGTSADGPLSMDVYHPPARGAGARPAAGPATLPAVVIVAGYPDRGFQTMLGCRFKEMGSSVSWAQLIAASGLVAITYANRDPAADLVALLELLRRDAGELGIDATRMGLWASSGNVPLALSALMDPAHGAFRCAALCYGLTLDLDGSTAVAEAARAYGFANPAAGRSIDDLPTGVPTFLARAGQDQFAGLNAAMDGFVAHALRRNLPITVINHPSGPHAFDLFDDSETSREIVRQVLRFLQLNLLGGVPQVPPQEA
jgi:hypothetical protein